MLELFLAFIYAFNWFILVYFLLLNLFYFILLCISAVAVARYNREFILTRGVKLPAAFVKPFSLLIPAFN